MVSFLQRNGKELEATPNASALFDTPIPPPASPQVNDLFSAHNFDIQIDLPSTDDGSELCVCAHLLANSVQQHAQ